MKINRNLPVILNNIYLVFFSALILYCSYLLIGFHKYESFILLNSFHHDLLDYFFVYWTSTGDGLFIIAIALGFTIRKNYKLAILLIAAFLFSGLLVQVAKTIFHFPRPRLCISNETYKHFIQGISLGGYSSFPSGHSTSIFAAVTIISIYYRNNHLAAILFLAAITTGYSRIYLGQHFLPDVMAGALLGIFSAALIYYIRMLKPLSFISQLRNALNTHGSSALNSLSE